MVRKYDAATTLQSGLDKKKGEKGNMVNSLTSLRGPSPAPSPSQNRNNEKDSFSDPDVLLSDNNGLAQVVEVLEELYTSSKYLAKEAKVSSSGLSLREQGKIVTALYPTAL